MLLQPPQSDSSTFSSFTSGCGGGGRASHVHKPLLFVPHVKFELASKAHKPSLLLRQLHPTRPKPQPPQPVPADTEAWRAALGFCCCEVSRSFQHGAKLEITTGFNLCADPSWNPRRTLRSPTTSGKTEPTGQARLHAMRAQDPVSAEEGPKRVKPLGWQQTDRQRHLSQHWT